MKCSLIWNPRPVLPTPLSEVEMYPECTQCDRNTLPTTRAIRKCMLPKKKVACSEIRKYDSSARKLYLIIIINIKIYHHIYLKNIPK